MNDPTKWWWVRHAPVVDAHLKRLSGQADVAADITDKAAFEAFAKHLPKDAVWLTTPLQRTAQTASALGCAAADPTAEPAFMEQAFGDWTHCTWDEIGEKSDVSAFWRAPADVAPPQIMAGVSSESFADVCARVAPAIEALNEKYAGRDIISVAHAGSIRAAVAHALGLSPAQALGLAVNNLSLTRLDHMAADAKTTEIGNWRVVGLNQIW